MTIKTLSECDKCKQQKIGRYDYGIKVLIKTESYEYDLCDTCLESFAEWLENEKLSTLLKYDQEY